MISLVEVEKSKRIEGLLSLSRTRILSKITEREKLAADIYGTKGNAREILKTPEIILHEIQDAAFDLFAQTAGDHTIYDQSIFAERHNGISMSDLMGEKDQIEFSKKSMIFLAALPSEKTNIWSHIINSVFLTPSFGESDINPDEFFKDKDLSQRIFLFQSDLVAKLLLPAFDESAKDDNFDRLFGEFIDHFPELTANLAAALFQSATRGLMAINMFDRPESIEKLLEKSPWDKFIFSQVDKGLRNISQYDNTVQYFLLANNERIFKDLMLRFKDNQQTKSVFKMLRTLIKRDIREDSTDEFMVKMQANLGELFFETYNKKKQQVEETTAEIWKDAHGKWLASDTIHSINFTDKSLPAIMGFEEIVFEPGKKYNQPVTFYLRFKGTGQGISGQIKDGRIINLSVNIETKLPGVNSLIELITISCLHDLVVNKKEIYKLAKLQASKKPGQIVRRSQSENIINRNNTIYLHEHDLIKIGEKRFSNFTPRIVDPHKMHVAYGAQYSRCLTLYNNFIGLYPSLPEEDKNAIMKNLGIDKLSEQGLLDKLEELRLQLAKPNPERIKKLPQFLRDSLEEVTDPETDEELLLETWVVEYSAPTPTDEEISHPKIHWEHRYKEGSSVAFLSVVASWMVEGL